MISNKNMLMILSIVLTWSTYLVAGNLGKIAGTVRDKQTGELLLGANVVVRGTQLGAASDKQGFFYILQVPPGTYDVQASYIGYHTITVRNVKVRIDLTTRIDFELESEAIEGPTVVVVAEQPLVQKDITATRRTTSRAEIEAIPGLEQTLDIFTLYGGTFIDTAPQAVLATDGTQLQVRDASVKDIHVRGGRGGEILYMVDGVPITHPIYGGRDVLELNVVDIEEIELLTGAFNAEYGQAQSGVVNITTRTGGDKFVGGVEYKTDDFEVLGESQSTHYTSFYSGGPEPITGRLLPKLGLKIPGKITYFISGNVNLTNTLYNNQRVRDQISVLGVKLREKQNNTGNFNAKLRWAITNNFRMGFSYHGSWRRWSNFDWLWTRVDKDAAENNLLSHTPEYSRSNQNFILKINHTLSKSTYYTLNFGYLSVDFDGSLNGSRPSDFWTFYKDGTAYDYRAFASESFGLPDSVESTIKASSRDLLTQFWDSQSFDNIWRDDLTRSFTFKGDITSQIHSEHLIKLGIEIQYHDLQYIDIQDGGEKLSRYGEHVFRGGPEFPKPVGPFPEFGQDRWVFDAFPIIGGAYIQDKFEKESLIMNIGVRFDWFVPGRTVQDQEWKTQWETATGLDANWSRLKTKVSPRIGISFPVSDRTVAFFSYGHFNQLPELQFFYRDPWTGGFTGNPHLDYEQTILYEFGFTHQFAEDLAVDIKSYVKDISQQVGTTRLRAALGIPVELHDNNGYGRARGLEFEVIKRHSNYTSGKVTYTVQWTNGYSSSAFEDYIRSLNDFPNPIRERRLSWDMRHQVIFQATIAAAKNQNMNLLGLRLPDNWNITVLSRFSSGQPYTPFTFDAAERQIKENSETASFTATTDLRINKSFDIIGHRLSLYADIFNVFNQKNVQINFGFNSQSGEPFKYGDTQGGINQLYRWFKMVSLMDLRQLSTGRYAKIGLRIDW